jgi:RNA polymerase sigma factor (sigma-70 family)
MDSDIKNRGVGGRSDRIGRLLSRAGSRPLGAQLQNQLAASYQRTRDHRLEQKLVEANLRLVAKIAYELDRSRGRQLEDLVQEGCLGLIEAVRRFDSAKGTQFSTYAGFWIRAFIMRHIMDNVRVVRAVRTRADRVAFFRGEVVSSELSFDAAVRLDGLPLCEILAEPGPSAEEVIEAAELAHRAKTALAEIEGQLSEREATILKERLLAAKPKRLRDVGRELSISGERVRQIEGRLLATIQAGLGVGPAPIAAAA